MSDEFAEKPCPDCNEMVRPNSVRCWNCGGFMKKEMAVKYQQMQMNPKPLGYLDIAESDLKALPLAGDDGDDFELSIPMTQSMAFTIPPMAPSSGQVRIEPPADTSEIPSLAISPLMPPNMAAVAEGLSPLPSFTEGQPTSKSERPKSEDDTFFDMVKEESAETIRRKKQRPVVGGVRTATGGFIIYCPYGCRFEVKEAHRGMQGKCPRCKAPFIVPIDPPDFSASKKAEAATTAPTGPADSAGGFSGWLKDFHLHAVAPDKLKLKADSLLKEFAEYDIGFSAEQMLIVNSAKRGGSGLFGGGGDKKKTEARDAMLLHLKEGKQLAELAVTDKQTFTADQVRQLRVVQPVTNRADSLFAGIPIFGAGRIAVMMPYSDDPKALPQYLSFTITEFRAFAAALQQHYGMENFGGECGAPLVDAYDEPVCTSTNATIRVLKHLDYYKADPTIKLAPVGHQCGSCKLTISEAGVAKDKLGGKDGKAMAKQKCPKCQQKMGDNPLLNFAPEAPPAASK